MALIEFICKECKNVSYGESRLVISGRKKFCSRSCRSKSVATSYQKIKRESISLRDHNKGATYDC